MAWYCRFRSVKSVHGFAKNIRCLTLIQVQILAHVDDIGAIDIGGIGLALKQPHQLALTSAKFPVQDHLAAGTEKPTGDCWNRGGFALLDMGVSQVHQFHVQN
ncbi:hypothetical protein IWX87_003323 [Polaromonas sp. CG_9.7]|nr:hypothetical protein [Polaromonas sp. CG_9.7]MBG6115551.1 hypothetical protein [Polaromonas sp. CG_9.2]MDH6185864.1 hypothetical protein [Polaromonas sp. CG_23.6]